METCTAMSVRRGEAPPERCVGSSERRDRLGTLEPDQQTNKARCHSPMLRISSMRIHPCSSRKHKLVRPRTTVPSRPRRGTRPLHPSKKPLHRGDGHPEPDQPGRPRIAHDVARAGPERVGFPLPRRELGVFRLVGLRVSGFLGGLVFLVAADVAEEPGAGDGSLVGMRDGDGELTGSWWLVRGASGGGTGRPSRVGAGWRSEPGHHRGSYTVISSRSPKTCSRLTWDAARYSIHRRGRVPRRPCASPAANPRGFPSRVQRRTTRRRKHARSRRTPAARRGGRSPR
jgi:hypothetical protein